jgi:uncharacterized protein (TIGR02594 family)
MALAEPLLLRVARLTLGLVEISGPASNPVILQWARDIRAPKAFTNDDTAWCAVATNRWAMTCGYPLSGAGYDLLRAKSFATWGEPIAPTLGAVLVFRRPEGHHVGLYVGERPDAYCVLGGNQGNAVSYAWIEKARLEACRWPLGVPRPTSPQTVLLASAGQVSSNEA